MIDLEDVVGKLEVWKEGRGVLLHGTAGTFCSGGDLNLMNKLLSPSLGADMCRFMQDVLLRMFQLPLITLAFIEGLSYVA